jgi:hypothetical protein
MKLRLNYSHFSVPHHTAETLENYLFHGYEPGSFVTSILCNDLMGACTRCDYINADHIVPISKFVLHSMPGNSWGNMKLMRDWMKDEGGIRSHFVKEFEKRMVWETLSTKG